jgi:hypothetical protein
MASQLGNSELKSMFYKNFHVKHVDALEDQRERLVLVVKGHPNSKLLQKAFRISSFGRDRADRPLKVLSKAMQAIFGDFDGHIGIQRCAPGWVAENNIAQAADFVRSLV